MKISELIAELEKLKHLCGDVTVYHGGQDYPEEVRGVYVQTRDDSYVPKGCGRIG